MIIKNNLTGASSYVERFQCSASKLGFQINESSNFGDWRNSYITVVVVDALGVQKVVTPRTKLSDLAEIAASNEGYIQVKRDFNSSDIQTVQYTHFTIELSNFGSIDLSGGYGQIQLDSCPTSAVFNIYGIDNPNITNMVIDYQPVWLAANQYKQIDVRIQ